MSPGDAFRFTRGSGDDHLWIILTDPSRNPDRKVAIANVTTWRPEKDQTCILEPPDHPLIKHQSCMAYEYARIQKANRLEKLEVSGTIHSEQPFSPDVLQRIVSGAIASRRIPLKVQDFILAYA